VLQALDGQGLLHEQVYRAIRMSILAGKMRPGVRLPSTRSLGRQLGISRTTVLSAYEQLTAEGYLTGRPGSGTYVSQEIPDSMISTRQPAAQVPAEMKARTSRPKKISAYAARIQKMEPASRVVIAELSRPLAYNFQYAHVATQDFPFRVWSNLLARYASRAPTTISDPAGTIGLRTAIAEYLLRVRGVSYAPEQVIVVNGALQGIDLILRVLLDPGDTVAIEDPHLLGARDMFLSAGAKLLPVSVDEDGICVRELERRREVKAVFVTPSHQFPTGATMSVQRRQELLDWAAQTGTYILEDDYDGEYRYRGAPLESLQGMDRNDCVIYIGTFSRTIFPELLGYIVVPPSLVKAFRDTKWLVDRHTFPLLQDVVGDFLRERHFEHYLRRLRARSERRRDALLGAIQENFGDRAKVYGADAGIHVMMCLEQVTLENVRELVLKANDAGVGVYSTLANYLRHPRRAELLLGYSALSEPAIRSGIRILRECVEALPERARISAD
jgi:GntR family transcriptional regulator / MocR family aminotransferase